MKKLFLEIKKILFIISTVFVSLFLCGNYELKYIKYLLILSFISSILLTNKVFEKFDKKNKREIILSIVISLYIIFSMAKYIGSGTTFCKNIIYNYLNISIGIKITRILLAILSVYSITIIIYNLILFITPIIKNIKNKLEDYEKKFLLIISIISFIGTTIIYYKTNAFYEACYKDRYFVNYDVIYTTDSTSLNRINAYSYIGAAENDLRQPLFGLFALPFSLSAKLISSFLIFIPNSYYVIFTTIQIFLLFLSYVLIEKMLDIKKNYKKIFLLLSLCSTTFIIFPLIYEQYIIAFFYLILTIYISYTKQLENNYFYIPAVGTLLTSGVIFPLISSFKNIKYWLKNMIKCLYYFLITLILSGQILQIFTLKQKITSLIGYTGEKVMLLDKIKQYLYFVKSIFIAPTAKVILSEGSERYRQISIDYISIVGIIIIIVCIISYFTNRKEKIAKIASMWIIFSIILLCIIGWGTKENGLILYTIYFSWAFLIMIFLVITKVLDKIKNKFLNILLILTICILMLIPNIIELTNIIEFGIKYYY